LGLVLDQLAGIPEDHYDSAPVLCPIAKLPR
jgi:hypothetical protein